MPNIQKDKRSIYIAVKVVCNKNKSVWNSLVAFVEAFGELDTTISEIALNITVVNGETTKFISVLESISSVEIQ